MDSDTTPPPNPPLSVEERSRFERLCLDTTSAELVELAGVVELHLNQVRELAVEATDLEAAERIADALFTLLSAPTGYAPDERALLRGAVEYFLLAEDASGDIVSPVGFDDDRAVVNTVLIELERPDLLLE
ncbi:MAG: hypothetical protein R2706_11775 [Acidimicrobiales bacterium]